MNKNILMVVAICSGLLGASVGGWSWYTQPKTAYVNLAEVFENFNGKKELAFRLDRLGNQQKSLLDSMELTIRSLQQSAERNTGNNGKAILAKLQHTQTSYQQLNAQFAAQYQEQDQSYSEKVWTQINQYVKEYGAANNYEYIFGINGNGSLMYSHPGKDVTKDVLSFINNRYDGI